MDVRNEVERLRTIPDLVDQGTGRVPITIGGQETFWSRGLSADSPRFLQHTINGTQRIHILAPDNVSVGVYDCQGKDIWERRAILCASDQILASLPKKAFIPEIPTAPATAKQLTVVRKVLDLPADEPLPPMSLAAASRLIDRVTIERALAVGLLDDLKRWVKESPTGTGERSAA
jgi:hypothetical protein